MRKRVVVLGNCQRRPLAICLNAIDPELQIKAYNANHLSEPSRVDEILDDIERADVVFAQPLETARASLVASRLKDRYRDVVPVPKLTFHGFHPDAFWLRNDKVYVDSMVNNFQSQIVAAAFANRMPEEKVPRLFNSYLFARLGYFDSFNAWKKLLLTHASEIGYDLQADFDLWLQEGIFMFTPGHPAIRVLATVAVRAFALAGLGRVEPPHISDSVLKGQAILPVYPEIAQRIGVPPQTRFRSKVKPNGDRQSLSLSEYIQQSYNTYAELPPRVFDDCSRLDRVRKVIRQEVGHG